MPGFPGSSAGKESVCSAGDLGLIPGLGRPPGEGIDYPLQYSWASLVAQLVNNRPAMQEIWVQSLGWEDPLEKGKATHTSVLTWRIPWPVMPQVVKNLPASVEAVREARLIPGSVRPPGGGHGNKLQYSCLENSMHRGAWWAQSRGPKRAGHD